MRNLTIALVAFLLAGLVCLKQGESLRRFEEAAARLRLEGLKARRALETERTRIEELKQLRAQFARNTKALEGKVRDAARSGEELAPSSLGPEREGAWPDGRPYFYLAKTHLGWLSYPALTEGLTVHPDAAVLLGMSDGEKERVDSALSALVQQVRDWELRNSYYTNSPAYANSYQGERVSVVVPMNPDLDRLKEATRRSIMGILGEDRGGLFTSRVRESEHAFSWIAPTERTLTYVSNPVGGGTLIIAANGGQSHSTIGSDDALEEQSENYAHIVKAFIRPKLNPQP